MRAETWIGCGLVLLGLASAASLASDGTWRSLFNGKDLAGWKVPEGDRGHWKVVDGVIDYDASSEAPKNKDLWNVEEFGDFELEIEWRIKETKGEYPTRIILPDGSYKLGPDGKPISVLMPSADSGIYLRGFPKSQLNIWCWPAGSGEIWGYRGDLKMPASVRAGCVPKVRGESANIELGECRPTGDDRRGRRASVGRCRGVSSYCG